MKASGCSKVDWVGSSRVLLYASIVHVVVAHAVAMPCVCVFEHANCMLKVWLYGSMDRIHVDDLLRRVVAIGAMTEVINLTII